MIWLIGNKGMLGTELSLLLKNTGLPFIGTDRDVDIASAAALEQFTGQQTKTGLGINWILNCAAYTAVDKAEDDAETCCRLNTLGAANIAACAQKTGARLIHISTDYVFDGQGITSGGTPASGAARPYREDDATNPTGVYGRTKRDGERAVLENNPRSYIVRTAWLYGKHGNNFVHTMLRLMNERDEVKVVNDQRGSPTWAFDLASAIVAFINMSEAGKNIPFGIYHYTNRGNITWFEFAREIFRQGRELGRIGKDCAVTPCTSADYPAKVKRPAYSVLDTGKIKAALGMDVPAWDTSLGAFLKTCVN